MVGENGVKMCQKILFWGHCRVAWVCFSKRFRSKFHTVGVWEVTWDPDEARAGVSLADVAWKLVETGKMFVGNQGFLFFLPLGFSFWA